MSRSRIVVSNGNPMEEIAGLSRAVRVGPLICVGGTAPVNENGETVGVGCIDEQARQCYEIIKQALERAGARMQDVVRTRTLLTDINVWKQAIDVRKEYFPETRPVETIMAVDRFVNADWLIEIEVDAYVEL